MARAGLLLVVTLCAGCQASITEVPLDEIDFSYAFLVTADDSGAPQRVAPAFGRADGTSGLPGLTLEGREARFFIVSFTEASLRAAFPGLDTDRLETLELLLGAPPDRPRYLETPDLMLAELEVELPSTTLVHAGPARAGGVVGSDGLTRMSLEASRLSAGLKLVVPVDAEYCRRADQSPLEPFTGVEGALPAAHDATLGVRELLWADDATLVVISSWIVARARRNEPYRKTPSTDEWRSALFLAEVADAAGEGEVFSVAALEPASEPGRRRLWLGGGIAPDPDTPNEATPSWVRTIWVTEEGLQWTGEPEIFLERFPRTMAFREDGVLLVGTHEGLFYALTSSSAFEPFSPAPTRLVPDDDDAFAIEVTGHPTQPLLAATKAAMHVFETTTDRWRTTELTQGQLLSAEPIKFLGVDTALAGGKLAVFASTQNGDVFWRPDRLSPWLQPDLPYPPRFRPCASAANDDQLIYKRRPIHGLEVEQGLVFMAYETCGSMVVLEQPAAAQAPLCVYLIPEKGHGVRATRDALKNRVAVATRPGAAALAASDGSLYVSEW